MAKVDVEKRLRSASSHLRASRSNRNTRWHMETEKSISRRVQRLLACSILAFSMIPTGPSAAAMFCNRPSKPYIPGALGAGVSSMQSAEQDVQEYVDQMNTYVQCLADEMEDARSEASNVLDEWNSTVQQFNNQ